MYKCGDMTGMVMKGKFMDKGEKSEHKTHMKEMEGK
jgi:hypothetical protein